MEYVNVCRIFGKIKKTCHNFTKAVHFHTRYEPDGYMQSKFLIGNRFISYQISKILAFKISHRQSRNLEDVDMTVEFRSEVVKVTQLDYTFDRQIELEREDAKREGIEQGIGQGEVIKLITQTCKKKRKGIPPREAAEMLEEDETVVYRIYQIADECATDSDVDAIYQKYCAIEGKSDS